MPHYSDGVQAEVGDFVVGKASGGQMIIIGIVTEVNPDSDACNIRVHPYHRVLERGGIKLVYQLVAHDAWYGTVRDFKKLL